MNYYNNIKDLLINNELTKKAKDYSKCRSDLTTYYEVGKLLSVAGKHYGEGIIKEYSSKLVIEIGKKYNERTLRRMKQLYNFCEKQKWPAAPAKLTISHYDELMRLNDTDEINYYIEICDRNNISSKDLRKRIKNKEYLRLDEETRKKIVENRNIELIDTIKEPILIRNNLGIENITEKMLQKLILENLNDFLEELGEGYSYIKNEYKIKLGDSFNYIDLLLYNIKYNCYVVVELKVTPLKKEHLGQISFYMDYVDENIKTVSQNNTIGILIVKENNKFIIKYKTNDKIISKEYKLI